MHVRSLLCAALVVVGGTPAARGAEPTLPEATAARVEAAPLLDGEVLSDPAWSGAPAVSQFWQATPDEGQPASERTEVRIAYTAEHLYLGVVCFDREPDRIIVSQSRRDSPLDDTDSFQLIFDTYLDRQNGFVFGTNPAGIEYDGQVTNEGQGERGVSGSLGGFNLNWDAAWQVKARSGAFGWSAEFAIPWRTLRYAMGSGQQWGMNLQRNIRRRKEVAYWAPLSRQFNLYRLSSAGRLSGLEPPPQRNLKLAPYVLGQAGRDYRTDEDARLEGDVGADLKYSVTPSLTLDLTVNTDFAQVEADEQQINLDRFSLFFPEKRPFFLENAGLFSVGTPGEVELVFSRRIGISPDGEPIPILAGGRLSGKLGSINLGLLNMQTRATQGRPAQNFAVARVSRELSTRSNLGVLFVNREGTGELASSGDSNRLAALDGKWGIGRYAQLYGYAALTRTPGITQEDFAYNVSATWSSPGWDLEAKYTEVGEGFNPGVGFLQRSAYRKPDLLIFRRYRPSSFLGLLEMRPHVSYRGFWQPDGFHESGFLHMDTHWEWKSGHEVHTGVNITREGVRTPFEIYPGVTVPPGGYEHREIALVAFTNQGAPLSFDGSATLGGFFGGDRASLSPSIKMRVGETLNAQVLWNRNDIDLPGGSFVTNLVRTRVSFSWTPRIFVQALVQYNDRDDNWSTNLRFGWLQTANTGLFLVYNETREIDGLPLGVRDRSFVIKYSRLVDLLD